MNTGPRTKKKKLRCRSPFCPGSAVRLTEVTTCQSPCRGRAARGCEGVLEVVDLSLCPARGGWEATREGVAWPPSVRAAAAPVLVLRPSGGAEGTPLREGEHGSVGCLESFSMAGAFLTFQPGSLSVLSRPEDGIPWPA